MSRTSSTSSTSPVTRSLLIIGAALSFGVLTPSVHAAPKLDAKGQVKKAKPKYDKAYVLKHFVTELGLVKKPFIGEFDLILDLKRRMTSRIGRRGVMLIADPGTGKTALVYEVAYQLHQEGYHTYALDMDRLHADTNEPGEVQARYVSVIDAFSDDPMVNLFIDEVHGLQMGGNLKNSLKMATNDGQMGVTAATTSKEARETQLEADQAIMSRFEVFNIQNATYAKLVAVLVEMKKSGIEDQVGVKTSPETIYAIARATLEFFPNDPPIRMAQEIYTGILDTEAQSRKEYSPDVAVKLNKKTELMAVKYLEKENLEFAKSTGHEKLAAAYQTKLDGIDAQIAAIDAEIAAANSHTEVRRLHSQIAQHKQELERIAKLGKKASGKDIQTAVRLQSYLIPTAIKRLQELNGTMVDNRATRDDVGRFVGKKIGIPAEYVTETVAEKVKRVRKILDERVIGHDDVKDMICDVIAEAYSDMRPMVGLAGLMLFDGGTGDGKTELIEAIAIGLFGDLDALFPIEFATMGEHSAMRISGSGPGLVGSEQGGIFEPVRQRPASMMNGDEFDKAHRLIIEMLHRPFDKGETMDAMNRRVDLHHAFFAGSSNYTGNYPKYKNYTKDNRAIEDDLGLPKDSLEDLPPGKARDSLVLRLCMIKKNISLSMLNRLQNRIMVDGTTPETAEKIGRIMANKVVKRARETVDWDIQVGEGVAEFIGTQYFGWLDGGRNIGTGIKRDLIAPLQNIYNTLEEQGKKASAGGGPRIRFGTGTVVRIEMVDVPPADPTEFAKEKIFKFYVESPFLDKQVDDQGIEKTFAEITHAVHDFGPPPSLDPPVQRKQSAKPGQSSLEEEAAPAPKAEWAAPKATDEQLDLFESCSNTLDGTKGQD